jgi:hypothetical protein
MNSSTSTSELGWTKLILGYFAWTLTLGLAVGGAIIGLDPYDTGRFAAFGDHGVPQFGQRLSFASLARNPEFNSAIIGNSTMQLLDPARISVADGDRVVSLAIPGTGPLEQLSVARWFMRHHEQPAARALIIGLDGRWCDTDQAPQLTNPFPFWLYSPDVTDYIVHVMQYQSLESAARKVRLLLGLVEPARADGYHDYDVGRSWDRASFQQRVGSLGEDGTAGIEPKPAVAPTTDFPAAALLRDFLKELPDAVRVVMVIPPQFRPLSNGVEAVRSKHCEQTFGAFVGQRPRTLLLNFLARDALTQRDEDYWDTLHFRAPIARVMEAEIAAALAEPVR